MRERCERAESQVVKFEIVGETDLRVKRGCRWESVAGGIVAW